MMHIKGLFMCLGAVLVLGCGGEHQGHEEIDCAQESRADTYVAGLQKTGDGGLRVALVASTPAPPAKGDNAWHLRVLDSEGAALDNATVQVEPFMPDHNHGTPIVAEVTPLEATGEFEAYPVNLWMPGFWTVTVEVIPEQGPADEVVFNFCIDG